MSGFCKAGFSQSWYFSPELTEIYITGELVAVSRAEGRTETERDGKEIGANKSVFFAVLTGFFLPLPLFEIYENSR